MNALVKTTTALHRRTLLATALLAAGLGCSPGALASPGPGPVDLTVIDRETGAALPFWRQGGSPFVAGDPGHRYGLRVSNRTGGRVLLVLSVDGVNVLTGETAGYDGRGYVLNPYQSYAVNGWRKSDSEVAAFTFASLSRSYAARTGRPGDVGVIGMAVFRERAPPPVRDVEATRDRTWERSGSGRSRPEAPPPLPIPPVPAPVAQAQEAPSPSPAAPQMNDRAASVERPLARRQDERLGTGHGAREWSSVVNVSFERASASPQTVRRIEYDTAPHLLARGVTPPYPPVGRPPPAVPAGARLRARSARRRLRLCAGTPASG